MRISKKRAIEELLSVFCGWVDALGITGVVVSRDRTTLVVQLFFGSCVHNKSMRDEHRGQT